MSSSIKDFKTEKIPIFFITTIIIPFNIKIRSNYPHNDSFKTIKLNIPP